MGLIVKIGADLKNFDKEMKKLTQDVNRVGDKLKGVGTKLTTSVTLPVLGVATAATLTGIKFEEAMSKVAAISGATGDDLASLEQKAREMGSTTRFSATEAADAFTYMSMAGWKTEEMLNGIDGIMALAAASGEDLASVSDIVTDALTAFGMTAADSAKFADVLAASSSNANTDVSMMGESFKYVAPVAGALGMSAEDTSKALGLMANAGIKGSQSGTALRTMLTNLAKPTATMEKAMEELGISLTNTDGSMKTLDEVMLNLRGSFDGLDQSQQAAYAATIFGKEAMSGALAIINASEEDYNNLSEAILNSEGAAQQMADAMNDNLSGRLRDLQSKLSEVALIIYDALQPALEKIVSVISKLADWFANLSPKTQQLIMGFAALAAAIGPILIAVGTGIILFGKLKAALAILKISMLAVTWPILAVIAALAAIVAVVVYWEDIKKYFIQFWAFVKALFNTTLNAISTKWSETWNNIKAVATAVWNSIKSKTSETWNGIKNSILTPVNNVRTSVVNAFNGMKNGVLGAWSSLQGGIKTTINSVIKMINKFINGFNTPANLLSKIPGVSMPKIPNIPMLATGGNVFGNGRAIVGEAGPELIEKSGSSVKVTPLSAQEKAQGISGSVGNQQASNRPIYLNVDGKTFARLVGPYSDMVSGTTVKLVERGLTP